MRAPRDMQLSGIDEVEEALLEGLEIPLVLITRDASDAAKGAAQRIRIQGGRVIEVSDRDLWRMRRGEAEVEILGLVGRNPGAPADQVLRKGGGCVWVLSDVRYPGNLGAAIRTVEVAGASAVIVDWEASHRDQDQARRISMGADRFLPVLRMDACDALMQAAKAGFRRIAIETGGDKAPWDVDLTGDIALVVGAEDTGIPAPVLAVCDDVVSLPMTGFVPSYNLQAAVAAVAIERLRQLEVTDERR